MGQPLEMGRIFHVKHIDEASAADHVNTASRRIVKEIVCVTHDIGGSSHFS